jgi:hypothetical protein
VPAKYLYARPGHTSDRQEARPFLVLRRLPGLELLGRVLATAIEPVFPRPALSHHGGAAVLAIDGARRDGAAVTIDVTLVGSRLPAIDQRFDGGQPSRWRIRSPSGACPFLIRSLQHRLCRHCLAPLTNGLAFCDEA